MVSVKALRKYFYAFSVPFYSYFFVNSVGAWLFLERLFYPKGLWDPEHRVEKITVFVQNVIHHDIYYADATILKQKENIYIYKEKKDRFTHSFIILRD